MRLFTAHASDVAAHFLKVLPVALDDTCSGRALRKMSPDAKTKSSDESVGAMCRDDAIGAF